MSKKLCVICKFPVDASAEIIAQWHGKLAAERCTDCMRERRLPQQPRPPVWWTPPLQGIAIWDVEKKKTNHS